MTYDFARHIGFDYLSYNKQERLKYLERRAWEVLDWCGVPVRTNPFGQKRYFLAPVVMTQAYPSGIKSFLFSLNRLQEIPVVKTEQFLVRLIKLALKNKQRENERNKLTATQFKV